MARGDFWPIRNCGTPVRFQTKAGQTAILAGEPVIQDTSGDVEYVQAPGTEVTTSDTLVGFAATNDTVTATADGEVWVYIPAANSVFGGFAKTIANLAITQKLTKVVIDYTDPKYTVDESTTTSGLCLILDYNATSGEIEFAIDMTEAVNA
jgi:hypothetical protein